MKKKLIVFTIVLCTVSMLNVGIILNADTHLNDLFMTSIDAMGGNETGGSDICMTDITGSVSMQDCGGREVYARVTISYKCKGQGLGLCEEGYEYYFYDCEGAMIKNDKYTTLKSCK